MNLYILDTMYDNTVMSTLVASENPGQQSCCRTLTSHLYTTAYCPLPKNSSCIHVHLHLPITVISQQWPFSYVLNEATVEKFPCLCECFFVCLCIHVCEHQCVCLSVKLSLYLCVCLSILDNQCATLACIAVKFSFTLYHLCVLNYLATM